MRHQLRLRGGFFDRFAIRITLPALTSLDDAARESSAVVRERVVKARRREFERSLGAPQGFADDAKRLPLGRFSAVVRDHAKAVAQTIADLDGSEQVRATHLAEAIALVGSSAEMEAPLEVERGA